MKLLVCFGIYTKSFAGFNIQNEGEGQSEEIERPGAIISNHVSYVDILYHMSSSFPSFVAKVCSYFLRYNLCESFTECQNFVCIHFLML